MGIPFAFWRYKIVKPYFSTPLRNSAVSYSVTLAILRMAKLIALQVFVVSVRMRQLSVTESVFF